MLLVGIDWAEAEHAACLLDMSGTVVCRSRVPHSAAGLRRLRAAIAAVDGVFRLAGASALYADQPIQRCFRDLHALDTHAFLSANVAIRYAKHQLGIAQPPQLL